MSAHYFLFKMPGIKRRKILGTIVVQSLQPVNFTGRIPHNSQSKPEPVFTLGIKFLKQFVSQPLCIL